MNAIDAWRRRLDDQPWTKDGRLGFRLIVLSCLATIVVALLGPSTVTLNVGPADGSLLPPWYVPVEWGRAIGLPLPEWVVVPVLWIGISLGSVGLVLAWRAVTAGWRPRIHLMFGLGTALNLATAAVPPLTSADVLMYAAYGRLQRQGLDPYSITPAEIFRQTFDPVLVWTERPWQDTPSVYGPLASASQWLANALGGESMHDVVFWLQVMSVVPFIVICAVMVKLAHGDAALQTRSVLFTILNPLLIWAVVAGAHNEALTLVFAIAGLFFMRRSAFVTGIFIGLAGAVKVSLVFYGIAMVWGYRHDWRKVVALGVGAVIPLAVLYGVFAPQALFAAGRNTGYISGGSWAPWAYGVLAWVLPDSLARSLTGMLGWGGLFVIGWMLSRVLPWSPVPGATLPAERDPLTITVRTATVLCTAWLVTSPYTLSWYDLIAWAPLALLLPNRLDWLLVLRGTALSVAYVTGRTVGFSPVMIDVIAFIVRDIVCSGVQWVVLAAIVHWFWTQNREWPTRAFVIGGVRDLFLTTDGAAPRASVPEPVLRPWRRAGRSRH
ncbi:MAG: polyprenol phosphomannose-dependent alpha 1,6 mannosyltransferase MptB [Nigerium sp.]|nr:polyprenol phosphomannose-dependent alpha 1,6 mannosyltransferase MptB [Nigerium sp.]